MKSEKEVGTVINFLRLTHCVFSSFSVKDGSALKSMRIAGMKFERVAAGLKSLETRHSDLIL